ncbi:MAG: FAD:protein transferase [Thermodesulfobacteriota bacterium]|nr:FAD:protein transferase [Thermodesulfobacteriota bacterium]
MKSLSVPKIAGLLTLAVMMISCIDGSKQGLHKESRFLMGTLVTVTLPGEKQHAARSSSAVLNEIARLEDLTSFHKPSMLNTINDSSGTSPMEVSEELLSIVKLSLVLANQTDGAFDPTIGAVARLWNFSGSGQTRVPPDSEVQEALPLVDWRLVQIDDAAGTVFLPRKGMALDLGGMVKAYALEQAKQTLLRLGIQSALVDIGGDILALGEKSVGQKWRIGIRDPQSQSSIRGIVALKDRFILTSGDYERYLASEGVHYHHILDPRTGYPVQGVRSVTLVVDDSLLTAPAGVFVMGLKKGLVFIDQFSGVYGWIIDADGEVHSSKGAEAVLEGVGGR